MQRRSRCTVHVWYIFNTGFPIKELSFSSFHCSVPGEYQLHLHLCFCRRKFNQWLTRWSHLKRESRVSLCHCHVKSYGCVLKMGSHQIAISRGNMMMRTWFSYVSLCFPNMFRQTQQPSATPSEIREFILEAGVLAVSRPFQAGCRIPRLNHCRFPWIRTFSTGWFHRVYWIPIFGGPTSISVCLLFLRLKITGSLL